MQETDQAREFLLKTASGFQASSILGSAAELELFSVLIREGTPREINAAELALECRANLRTLTVLLDALVSLGVLLKKAGNYRVAPEYVEALDVDHPRTVVPMIQHMMACMRKWSQMPWTVRSGVVCPAPASIRGPLADNRAFILAMNSVGRVVVQSVVENLRKAGELTFTNFLDLGGASGTYTLAFLEALPKSRGTIFDLPIAIDEAKKRLHSQAGFADRVDLVAGDFYRDELPRGFDAVWISAIIHQHDRPRSRELYAKALRALEPGGRVLVRDVFADDDRTTPPAAAMFAVNMMSNTECGMVYTAAEVFEDLAAAGFRNARLAVPAEDMSAVIVASAPQ